MPNAPIALSNPMHIFTYGSLMFPEVWRRVVRGHYRSAPATVRDHARFVVKGETYPGMVSAADETVRGIVYFDVAPHDVDALDAFEGEDYRRIDLQASLDSGETITAGTYIYLNPARLTQARWQPETFQMQCFLDTYCRNRLAE